MKFTIPIAPMPRQEPHRSINGRMYTPQRMREYMDRIQSYLIDYALEQTEIERPFNCALRLTVKVYVMPPKKYLHKYTNKKNIRPSVRPDLSNYIKLIEDCMNGILYKDDGQIVEYGEGTGKYYSEEPRWSIEIDEIP